MHILHCCSAKTAVAMLFCNGYKAVIPSAGVISPKRNFSGCEASLFNSKAGCKSGLFFCLKFWDLSISSANLAMPPDIMGRTIILTAIKKLSLFFLSRDGYVSSREFIAGFLFLLLPWLALHIIFIGAWAVSLDGCTKCFTDIERVRIGHLETISLMFAARLLLDSAMLFCFRNIYVKRIAAMQLPVPHKTIAWCFIIYTAALTDWWGASMSHAMKCGNDCDPTMQYAWLFLPFGYALPVLAIAFYWIVLRLLLFNSGTRNPPG